MVGSTRCSGALTKGNLLFRCEVWDYLVWGSVHIGVNYVVSQLDSRISTRWVDLHLSDYFTTNNTSL